MYKKLISLTLISMIIASGAILTGCFGGEEEESDPVSDNLKKQIVEEDETDFDDPSLDYEQDGAEPVAVGHDEKDFYGNWEGKSERVEYLFGNVNLSIKDDGTWKGNVTEEKLKGKWKYTGKSIIIRDTDDLINWELYYTSDGVLLFKDLEEPEDSYVLKKGPKVN